MTTDDQTANRAATRAEFLAKIATFEAADRSGEVMMWANNGLCVILRDDRAGIGDALTATDVSTWRTLPPVTNGHNERAVRVTRGFALDYAIKELRHLVTWLDDLAA